MLCAYYVTYLFNNLRTGLGSERKQNEIWEVLDENGIDVVAGQESWEKEDTKVHVAVEGYK